MGYLKAENDYTRAVMKNTESLRKRLYGEMVGRIKETDSTVPARKDNFFYYSRTEKGKQYPIYCRKKDSLEADEQILLDANQLAAGHDYFRLGAFALSPDHSLLAYSVNFDGSEDFLLTVKDLSTDELLSDRIPGTSYSVEWANDNRTFFYTRLNPAHRPFQLCRHTTGDPAEKDALVYHEEDEAFYLTISRTLSERFLLLESESNSSSETRYLETDKPEGAFRLIQPRRPGVEYSVEHRGDEFFIVTNDQAPNFRLLRTPVSKPTAENWRQVIPARATVKLDGIVLFENHLVLNERRNGMLQVRIHCLESGETHRVRFDEPVYSLYPGNNFEFNTPVVRLHYTSLVTPWSVYDYHMDKRELQLKKQVEVKGGYDPSRYRCRRIYARAPDGSRVPISILHRHDHKLDGTGPVLLYGYGSYGASCEPTFNSNRLSWVDRGGAYAIAHVRGGEERGRSWYEDGKLLHKKNTFSDFIACAEELIARGFTHPRRMAIQGASAGGLLVGAVINQRPELFQAAVANVPFVDVINTMLDPSIPLTVIEYEEWGDPNKAAYFEYMRSYSPYENVRAQPYPHLLVTAGLNDPRVQYWEPAKWVAKLRAKKTDDRLLLLKTNMGAGHGGASGRYERLKEIAFEYAFLLRCLGMSQ